MQMPGMDGMALARAIQGDPALAALVEGEWIDAREVEGPEPCASRALAPSAVEGGDTP